jgi:HK97 gp10 family phage protein
MDVKVKVDGLKELERALRNLPDNVAKNGLRSSVRAGAKVIVDEAKVRAPVYSGKVGKNHPPAGTLRRSIIMKHIREASGRERQTFFVTVRSGKKYRKQGKKGNLSQDAFYWKFIEFGYYAGGSKKGMTYRGARKARREGSLEGARFIPAKPFIRPAFEARKTDALNAIKNQLSQRIEEESKKLSWR